MVFNPADLLKGKLAIVTGASSGIGFEVARLFAMCDAHVVMVSRSQNNLQKAYEKIHQDVPTAKVELMAADMSNGKAFEEKLNLKSKEWGQIDILVNNAGLTRDGLLMKMSDDDWQTVLDVNLSSVFYACRAVARPMMRQRSGSIINVSSVTALMGNAGQVNYGAAKAGMIGLTKSLAKELGSRNVRVNSIAPGFIDTKMTEELPSAMKEQYKMIIPQGRFGKPSEVANAVWFLASDLSSYITGQVLVVDGGLFMA